MYPFLVFGRITQTIQKHITFWRFLWIVCLALLGPILSGPRTRKTVVPRVRRQAQALNGLRPWVRHGDPRDILAIDPSTFLRGVQLAIPAPGNPPSRWQARAEMALNECYSLLMVALPPIWKPGCNLPETFVCMLWYGELTNKSRTSNKWILDTNSEVSSGNGFICFVRGLLLEQISSQYVWRRPRSQQKPEQSNTLPSADPMSDHMYSCFCVLSQCIFRQTTPVTFNLKNVGMLLLIRVWCLTRRPKQNL